MNESTRLVSIIGVAIAALGLAGCGGAKVLKQPEPLVLNQPLASASDQRLAANLDWVIVRGAPGAWARNADWDEYLIRVQNLGDDPVTVRRVAVLDSLGTRIGPGNNRKQLVRGAKDTRRRYKDEQIKIQAGAGAGALLTGAAVTAGASAAVVGSAGILSSTGAAAATGGLILVPALAIGGVFRGVNNSKVNREIESRQTTLPVIIEDGEEMALDIFLPLTPSPQQVEITYLDSTGEQTLVIDTSRALEGLHLVPADE